VPVGEKAQGEIVRHGDTGHRCATESAIFRVTTRLCHVGDIVGNA
jgi:hypothetical protein